MSGDALTCFDFLVTNVPIWITHLEGISRKIGERQKDISIGAIPAHPAALKVRKSTSAESIRPVDSPYPTPQISEVASATEPIHQAHQPSPPPTPCHLLSQRRNRKTASVLSGQQSGPSKYRSRSMIILYYNGEVQKLFEELVRHIGTGRNHVRKGKMAAKMDALSSDSSSDDFDDHDLEIDHDTAAAKAGSWSKTDIRRSGSAGYRPGIRNRLTSLSDATAALDSVEAALDKAQSLCERAAHQFLRDGDCSDEIDAAKQTFETVVSSGNAELPRLREKAEKARRKSADRRALEAKRFTQARRAAEVASAPVLLVDEIEVDDGGGSDDEDADVLAQFRITNSRLLAH
ncbi:hypothetical protein LTR66_014604 [Elasticomyces elasticus]|nr:hypothetical protein LTR66_014604 [Elasticomyces elasticus]